MLENKAMFKKNKVGYHGEGFNPGHRAFKRRYTISQFVERVSRNVSRFFDFRKK